jgi:DNA repair protein RadC
LSNTKFSDASWTILLDLYVEDSRRHMLPVGSVTVTSGVPQSTALRCVHAMAEQGLVELQGDPDDRRRLCVRLAPGTRGIIDDLLDRFLTDLWA